MSIGIHAAAVAAIAALATERIRREPPAPVVDIELVPMPVAVVEEPEPAVPEEPEPPEPPPVPTRPRPREVPPETQVALVDEARPFQEHAAEDGAREVDAEAVPAPTAPAVVDMSAIVGGQTDYVTTSSGDGTVPVAPHGRGAGAPGPTANQGAADVAVARDWQITRMPVPLNDGDSEPAFPPAARREGREAVVALRLWIDDEGRVTRVALLGERDEHGFAEAARAYARGLRFEPARAGEHRVAARIDWTVHFYLRNQR